MITSIQKIIRIGSSYGVTLPAKELRRANLKQGDEVEVTIRAVQNHTAASDHVVIETARNILARYKSDFQNLAQR